MDLNQRIIELEKENKYLKEELRKRGFIYQSKSFNSQQKINIYMDYFIGRKDVYAKKYYNNNTNKTGWTPVCVFEFNRGYGCKKGLVKKVCDTCSLVQYESFTKEILKNHFQGKNKGIGIYPLFNDNTCHLLAIDFDGDNWFEEMLSVYKKAVSKQMIPLMERSSSGMGGHLWLFFETPIKAKKARELGTYLIQETMKTNKQLSFDSFDRMFPNQDILPMKGLGNLIALPLQYHALKQGNTTFINEQEQVIETPIEYLSTIPKISEKQIDEILEMNSQDYFFENNQMFFDLNMPTSYSKEIKITEHTMLCIEKKGLNAYTLNVLKRLASMYNPEYYLKQRLKQPIYLGYTPRVLGYYEEDDHYLYLPRGIKSKIYEVFPEATIQIVSKTSKGHPIDVKFIGELRNEQIEPVNALLKHEMGILKAVPGFGKTVIGINVISQLKVNTLIIVQSKNIQKQWKERVDDFLEYPKSKLKRDSFVCEFNGSKKRLNKNIDIATASSLIHLENLEEVLNEYGLIIVDECHGAASNTFTSILRNASAHRIYGLSATPERTDKLEKVEYMFCGPIVYEISKHEMQLNYTFKQVLIPRATSVKLLDKDMNFNDICNELMNHQARNYLIIKDIIKAFKNNENIIVLTERIKHLDILYEMLKHVDHDVYVINGQTKEGKKKEILNHLKDINKNFILLATSKLLGEGFDLPSLSTLFLLMPISAESRIIQYTGRIHRNYEGKEVVKVYDYVDVNIVMMNSMFQKRLKQYQSVGYYVENDNHNEIEVDNMIYEGNDYYEIFIQDINQSNKEIVIMNSKITLNKLKKYYSLLQDKFSDHVKLYFVTNTDIETKAYIEGLGAKYIKNNHSKHFIVIDRKIVWYSNIDYFGKNNKEPFSTRFVDESFAEEILSLFSE